MKRLELIKISFFSHNTLPILRDQSGDFGGAELEFINLAKELAVDQNFEVKFFVLGDKTEYFQASNLDCIAVKRNGGEQVRRGNFWRYVFRLYRAFSGQKSDIYFTGVASFESIVMFAAARLTGARYVFRIEHDWETLRDKIHSKIFNNNILTSKLFIFTLKRADKVITQTKSQQDHLRSNFGIQSTVIPNAHQTNNDIVDFSNRENILWIGRIAPHKQPEVFLQVAKKVPRQKFVMVAGGEKNEYYRNIESQARLISNLQWVGGVPQNEVKSYYRQAKTLIVTSAAEGFPNVFIEAWLSGVPVVSLTVDPDDVIKKNQIGYCCDGDIERLIEFTEKIATEENLRVELAKKSLEYGRNNYDIKKLIARYKQEIFRI